MRASTLSFLLLLAASPTGAVAASGASGVTYAAYGQIYTLPVLEKAYARLKYLYAVDLDSRQCVPAKQMRAAPLRGTVELATGARILLKEKDGRKVSLLGYRSPMPKAGEPVDCVVIRSGAETLSVRNKDREVISIAQYRDVTMTFNDFVAYLRNGQHFPETPELKTQSGRKRLFSTERTKGNKVDTYLRQQAAGLTHTNAPVAGKPSDHYGNGP